MAGCCRFSVIAIPTFLYGGIVASATDLAILFFFDTDIKTINTGLYFWGNTACMFLWCGIWYPKLLWALTCDEFVHLYSNWKVSYKMAFLFSFGLYMLNVLLTGACIQYFTPDPYFGYRLLYTPASTLSMLFALECTGINHVIRTILLHDL